MSDFNDVSQQNEQQSGQLSEQKGGQQNGWVPIWQNEGQSNQQNDSQNNGTFYDDGMVVIPLRSSSALSMAKWASFIAVLQIIGGALICLGIVTIPIGIFMIKSGSKLKSAAYAIKSLVYGAPEYMSEIAAGDIAEHYKQLGISAIIGMSMSVLMFFLWMFLFMSLIFSNVVG